MQEIIEKKLLGGIMGIKNGTKQPKDVVGFLNKLKEINPLMGADYEKKYIAALESRKANDKK